MITVNVIIILHNRSFDRYFDSLKWYSILTVKAMNKRLPLNKEHLLLRTWWLMHILSFTFSSDKVWSQQQNVLLWMSSTTTTLSSLTLPASACSKAPTRRPSLPVSSRNTLVYPCTRRLEHLYENWSFIININLNLYIFYTTPLLFCQLHNPMLNDHGELNDSILILGELNESILILGIDTIKLPSHSFSDQCSFHELSPAIQNLLFPFLQDIR